MPVRLGLLASRRNELFRNGLTKEERRQLRSGAKLRFLRYLLFKQSFVSIRVNSWLSLVLSRPDREPLRSPSYLVLRLVHPSAQARQSAVRQDAALPALVSVPCVRSLVFRRRRTCSRCLRHNPGNNRSRRRAYILRQATYSLPLCNRDTPAMESSSPTNRFH